MQSCHGKVVKDTPPVADNKKPSSMAHLGSVLCVLAAQRASKLRATLICHLPATPGRPPALAVPRGRLPPR